MLIYYDINMWTKVTNIRIWYLIVYMFDTTSIVKVRADFPVTYHSSQIMDLTIIPNYI